jgi:hypothetical protein
MTSAKPEKSHFFSYLEAKSKEHSSRSLPLPNKKPKVDRPGRRDDVINRKRPTPNSEDSTETELLARRESHAAALVLSTGWIGFSLVRRSLGEGG